MGRKRYVLTDFDPALLMRETFEPNPRETRILKDVRRINESLAELSRLDDDARERLLDIIYGLIEEWPHLGREVVVSGWIKVSQRDINDDYPAENYVAARLDMPTSGISMGFDLVEIGGEDEYDEDEIYIAHMIGFDVDSRGVMVKPAQSRAPMFIGRAEIDAITMKDAIEDHYDLRQYLEKYYPKETGGILDCLLNAEDEVEALQAMGGLVIDVSNIREPAELNQQLSRYISRDIVFDTIVPYSAKFKGPMLPMSEEGYITGETAFAEDWQDVALSPESVQFLPQLVEDEEGVLVPSDTSSVPYLITKLYRLDDIVTANQSSPSVNVAIPLSDKLILKRNNENIKSIALDQE